MPDAGRAKTLYSHNIVGLQPCVWWGVDKYVGKGILVMIVHLICKGHSPNITTAPPSTALLPQGARGASSPTFLVTD